MARKDKPKGFTVNRREFLKSAGVVGGVTAAVSPPEIDAQTAGGSAALGQVKCRYSFRSTENASI